MLPYYTNGVKLFQELLEELSPIAQVSLGWRFCVGFAIIKYKDWPPWFVVCIGNPVSVLVGTD